jgi:hypothetical protein
MINLLANDKQESDIALLDHALLSQLFDGLDLSGHAALGITGPTSIDILLVFAVLDIGGHDIDMGVEEDTRVASFTEVSQDVLTTGSDGLELDGVAEFCEVGVEVLCAWRFVLGDAGDGDEAFVEGEEFFGGFRGCHLLFLVFFCCVLRRGVRRRRGWGCI